MKALILMGALSALTRNADAAEARFVSADHVSYVSRASFDATWEDVSAPEWRARQVRVLGDATGSVTISADGGSLFVTDANERAWYVQPNAATRLPVSIEGYSVYPTPGGQWLLMGRTSNDYTLFSRSPAGDLQPLVSGLEQTARIVVEADGTIVIFHAERVDEYVGGMQVASTLLAIKGVALGAPARSSDRFLAFAFAPGGTITRLMHLCVGKWQLDSAAIVGATEADTLSRTTPWALSDSELLAGCFRFTLDVHGWAQKDSVCDQADTVLDVWPSPLALLVVSRTIGTVPLVLVEQQADGTLSRRSIGYSERSYCGAALRKISGSKKCENGRAFTTNRCTATEEDSGVFGSTERGVRSM